MSWSLTIAGVLGLAVLVAGWLWRGARRFALELAEANGKLKGQLDAAQHEIRRLRGAMLVQGGLVTEMAKPDPTPGVLVDALRRQGDAEAGDQ